MKDDESIEEMYSRFQTLVSGLQILKKKRVNYTPLPSKMLEIHSPPLLS